MVCNPCERVRDIYVSLFFVIAGICVRILLRFFDFAIQNLRGCKRPDSRSIEINFTIFPPQVLSFGLRFSHYMSQQE